jgi:hypothetical protein
MIPAEARAEVGFQRGCYGDRFAGDLLKTRIHSAQLCQPDGTSTEQCPERGDPSLPARGVMLSSQIRVTLDESEGSRNARVHKSFPR